MITRAFILQHVVPPMHQQVAGQLGLGSFASDSAFVANKGSPAADGDRYFNTTLSRIRTFGEAVWHTVGGGQ